jgi:hypothetical protein
MISPPARLFYSGDVMDNTTHGYMPPRLRTKLVCATIDFIDVQVLYKCQ